MQSITLFTSPKSFTGHSARIQHNALRNWKALGEGVSVLLLGNDPGVADAAQQYGYAHIPSVASTEFGTPLLDDMFRQAQTEAQTPLVCYINADILLPANFPAAINQAAERWKQFLVVGQRWDVAVDEDLYFEDGWPAMMEQLRGGKGVLHSPTGIDYFAFPRGMITAMPPFAIGRPGWDNWLIWQTAQSGTALVNATDCLSVIHQNHNYAHVPGATTNTWEGSPETKKNEEILLQYPKFSPLLNTIVRAPWRIDATGIRHDFSRKRVLAQTQFFVTFGYAKLLRLARLMLGAKIYGVLQYCFKTINIKASEPR